MAGPDIPRWQAQQGVQAGAMGQAYDRAGALFGKVMESAQGILDQKIESESVPFMESILTAENTDDLAAAREGGLANKWVDQAKLGTANITQTKELKQQERDAALADRDYELKADDLDRQIRKDKAENKRDWARINNAKRSGSGGGGGAGGTKAQKEAAEYQIANYLLNSKVYASQDGNARDTALKSYQAAVGKDALSGNISEAVLTGNVSAFMDQKERELYLTALGDYTQKAGVPPDERVAEGLREQAQKTLAGERAAALEYAKMYSTEGIAKTRGLEAAFVSAVPTSSTGQSWYFLDRPAGEAAALAQVLQATMSHEDLHNMYTHVPPPTTFNEIKQVAPVIYMSATDSMIRAKSTTRPPEYLQQLEKIKKAAIDGGGLTTLKDVTDGVAKFRGEAAQLELTYLQSNKLKDLEKTWGVGKVPAKAIDGARALLVEDVSAEFGGTPEELGLVKDKIDRTTHDPLRTEGLKSVISKQFEALEEEKKKTGNLDPLLELIQGR